MVKNNQKHTFFIMHKRGSGKAHVENGKKLTFLAFRSDSQTLVGIQKLVALERFWLKSKVWTHEPTMSMMKLVKIIVFIIVM